MALIDDINALPTTIGDGNTGHLNNHQVVHAALKDHESRLISGTAYVDGRVPPSLALRLDTTVGTRIMAGTHMIHGDTGLRNIATLMSAYTSSTAGIALERTGATVSMNFYVRQFDVKGAVANDLLLTLPTGFRPTGSYRFLAQQPGGVALQVSMNGQVTVTSGTISSGGYATFNFMHLTRDAWPTTLPGTPA